MGKIGSLITTAVFIGAIALLVYLCFRNKRKRNLTGNTWSEFFGQNQNQQACPAVTGVPTSNVPAICAGSSGYYAQNAPAIYAGSTGYYASNVPHSIVSPPQATPAYPSQTTYPSYPYPGSQPSPSQPVPPYPIVPTGMPMPGTTMESRQNSSAYPPGYPEDLPPPYSVAVGQPGQRY